MMVKEILIYTVNLENEKLGIDEGKKDTARMTLDVDQIVAFYEDGDDVSFSLDGSYFMTAVMSYDEFKDLIYDA